eukprot:m.212357 g.212357  ORF g.212357 m.212357 type:complete len:409 (-) comp26154_c0_seq20:168-1394(-)
MVLPLRGNDLKENTRRPSLCSWLASCIRSVFESSDSRSLFLFFIVNFAFAVVELLYGFWTNSLGLICDAFHMFFDCSALMIGLVASVVTRKPANERMSYGYGRAEVLGGFINGLFLVFIACFVFKEALERLLSPPTVHTHRLLLVSLIGLLVNIGGIFLFQGHGHSHGGHGHSHGGHGHSHGGHAHSHAPKSQSLENIEDNHGHSHSHGPAHNHGHAHDHLHGSLNHRDSHSHGHGHSHENGNGTALDSSVILLSTEHDFDPSHPAFVGPPKSIADVDGEESAPKVSRNIIMDGVLLHILADTLGSVGVLISSALIHQYGWMVANPICSIAISALIFLSVIPLLKTSVRILMQGTPPSIQQLLPRCYRQIHGISGVVGHREPHFWCLTDAEMYGSIVIIIREYAEDEN